MWHLLSYKVEHPVHAHQYPPKKFTEYPGMTVELRVQVDTSVEAEGLIAFLQACEGSNALHNSEVQALHAFWRMRRSGASLEEALKAAVVLGEVKTKEPV